MEPVVLDGDFRLWSYGVGHSQLLLHAPVPDGVDTVSVLFEGARATVLRGRQAPGQGAWRRPENAEVLHEFRGTAPG
ncbi:hypothetical protein Aph02nite_30940 [Actinoplanes philippinensis]|uniref:Uncharacterized protein n=1 Tax=Actinoplanes philippinensis TaxID=35752 RepID=A0A1I2EA31_9ACTN|nr:hypothetical protein [Actinoplanes philippinensis]GIE77144.1 hypothetical protein Aph02nite_30940 [Actinoplanes philippinensis]SFE89792.1 hypothetical protein SAMN05421541_104311 [Actinoplanes philippinensis]